MLGTILSGQDKNRLDLESNFRDDRIIRPSASREFDLPVRSETSTLQNTLNQESRNNDRVNMSGIFKPFGLQTRNPLHSIPEENVRLQQSTSITSIRSSSNTTTLSRTFGLRTENERSSNIQNNSRLNQDVRNIRSSFVPTSFGLQMRNLSTLRDMSSNDHSRLNQNTHITNYRGTSEQLQMSNASRIFGPAFRNTTLTNGLQIQERCNDEIDNSGFRVPSVPKMIRGRNPISRLFSHQNIEKSINLSNINGFDVSHISRRDMDSMSESRLGLMRNGWMDKQSICGSTYSTGSVKAQAMNLVENLHYSILNMGPYISVDAVTVEIEKVKQGLENICEMSFAPSVRDADAVSIISQTSKYNLPAVNDQTRSIINGECVNLKSSKEVLKSLALNRAEEKSKLHLNETKKRLSRNKSCQNSELSVDQEENISILKKPKLFTGGKKSSRGLKIRTPPVKKNLTSKVTSKIINLKQWYPIAVGDDLALCGVDEQGVTARTEAVKKRINNRRVELINGISCHLIGSPSSMALALPEKIAGLLKNGLTIRWRVLQKELLNCQTAEEKKQKRKSKSPGWKKPPAKKSPEEKKKPTKRKSKSPSEKTPPMKLQTPKKIEAKTVPDSASIPKSLRRNIKGKSLKSPNPKFTPLKDITPKKRTSNKKSPRSGVISSPKKRDFCTRSGRAIKPPGMFWIAGGTSESSGAVTETPVVKQTKTTKLMKTDPEFTPKASSESHVNSTADVEESSKNSKRPRRKAGRLRKVKVPKSNKDTPEAVMLVSSTEESVRGARAKRKRDHNTKTESPQRKKSKTESTEQVEVESTVTDSRTTANTQKRKKTQTSKVTRSPKTKGKQQSKKKKETSCKKIVNRSSADMTETKFVKETEGDFELQLDDIEIPQFGNSKGNPLLSRSQLRLVSAETPPLKYFNSNLKVLSSTTPMRSPDWVISQRTESEVKQFQKRRAEAFKKKVVVKKTESKKRVVTEKAQGRELKKVLEWVAEKTIQSPHFSSKVLQYVLPSRRQLEQQQDEEEDEEEYESEFV